MRLFVAGILAVGTAFTGAVHSETASKDYLASKWDPIHFKPAIETATNEQCLACHGEILERRVRDSSPAGVQASDTLAWYQTLSTYTGEQDTFHRRHLVGDMATELMDLKCKTCHQANDPREETASSSATGDPALTQRKHVDPNICLMCHGKFPWEIMAGLTGPWTESGDLFANNCMACHAAFRTVRHQVNFLRPQAIEKAGAADGDVCYGCHGGRSWYRIAYPYPRNEWPGMAPQVPDWAVGRPTTSQPRFIKSAEKADASAPPQ